MFILYYTWIYDRIPLISLKNILIMLEKSLYYALASNLIFMVPLFNAAVASRKEKVYEQKLYGLSDESPKIFSGSEIVYDEDDDMPFDSNPIGVRYYNLKETNFFARPPFNCLLCFTFWSSLVGALIIPLIAGGTFDFTVCLTAPAIAVAFKRWFDSLPIKF